MALMNKKMPCMVAMVQLVPKEKFDFSFRIVSEKINLDEYYHGSWIHIGIVEPMPVGQPASDYLEQNVNKTLLKALTALCKEKPKDPVVRYACFYECFLLISRFFIDMVG